MTSGRPPACAACSRQEGSPRTQVVICAGRYDPQHPPRRPERPRWLTGNLVNEDGVMTVGSAIWGDQLTTQERAELGRGPGAIPDPRPDLLVVGGGILGVAT